MAYDGRYDDPRFINRFLSDMRITDDELAEGLNVETGIPVDENHYRAVEPANDPDSAVTSASSSPRNGTRAPPPTPESNSLPKSGIIRLPPIREEGVLTREQARMVRSSKKNAQSQHPTAQSPPLSEVNVNVNIGSDRNLEVDAGPISGVLADNEAVKNYQQQTLDNFKAQAEARIAHNTSVRKAKEKTIPVVIDRLSSSASPVVSMATTTTKHADLSPSTGSAVEHKLQAVAADSFRDAQDESTALDESSEDDDSSINIIVDAPETPDLFKTQKPATVILAPDVRSVSNPADAKRVSKATPEEMVDPASPKPVNKEESREHAIYFPTWGSPSARSGPPARVRMIVLANLPSTTDFTLVQSLIHGGAIDEMTISKTAEASVTAYVIFTSADACETYFNSYPNGLNFKYNGKKHVAFISKGDKVNVISGNLQSYLDCGASRIVKADGADEEWSMKALYKIAEGKSGSRKVEAIIDNCRNDNRTITFRFTKIADAVAFRGALLRSPEWQDARVQFAPDPCEKATGIH